VSYIFNEWWEKHSDEIFEAAREKKVKKGEPEGPSLYDWIKRCWELADDLAWINAASYCAHDLSRFAKLSGKNQEALDMIEAVGGSSGLPECDDAPKD
jgi:hypothetical protein